MFSEADTYFAILLAVQIAILLVLGIQGFIRHRARAKARQNYTDMTHVARLALASEITASVAHKVTQPLSSILADIETAQLLLDRKEPDLAAVRDLLADVRKEDLRANRFVESMRLPLRKHELRFERVDVNELTAEVLSMVLPDALRRKVAIQSNLEPGLPRIPADRLQLQQALLNLIDNALDSMDDTPTRTRRLMVCTESQDDDNVRISVLDSGEGIDPHHSGRLFDSFFTTKSDRLGLGLSMARAIVHMHGGAISAENRPSGGAAFSFTVPVSQKTETAAHRQRAVTN
ncbi:sensor histidine kinase [Steroidobacter cummioxidans]|uniref:sensor histidine kinase n=1 Tax=Steroidobacter cummioxidans TaxID=1803913 RepID=UPI00137B0322|nr:ATP-binding protein [Steroidobacter cummioxidans]